MKSPTAAVFDMDGTLVDNMQFHVDAWLTLTAKRGLSLTRELFERTYAGMKNEEILPLLFQRELPKEEVAALAHEKEEQYRALYRKHLAPLPGLMPLLDRLKKAGVRCAVATAAPPGNRELVLDGLDLRKRFEHVIGAEHAARGKPAPDIYLAAAKALGVQPSDCVAFEDAINGVLSARAAGMECVAVLTTTPEEQLRQAGARWILKDFTTLPADLEARLGL